MIFLETPSQGKPKVNVLSVSHRQAAGLEFHNRRVEYLYLTVVVSHMKTPWW